MKKMSRKLQRRLETIFERLPADTAKRLNDLLADPKNFQTLGLWTSALLAATVSVFYAKLFRWAELGFLEMQKHQSYSPLVLSPLFLLAAWYLVHRFSPEAGGSGIPQIMAANELGYKEKFGVVDRLLSLRTGLIKVASSILCVLGGGAVGREGPTLQISTCVFHFFGNQVRKILPNTGEHTWVVAGAAAGLASAFNTPLGGIVYAIEELGLVHFQKVRTALLGGVIVSGLMAQWLLGSYLFLGFPPLGAFRFSIMPIVILNGIVTGLAGAIFGKLLFTALKRRQSIRGTTKLAVFTGCCGLAVAGLAIFDHRAAGSGIHLVSGFLFSNEESSALLIITRFASTVISYLSGAAGGIFSPSLTLGATIGSYLAQFIAQDYSNLMVLLGMIGFLTGVTRTPFTSFILVLEMTDRHSALFPMMAAALTAHWIARLVDNESFYTRVKDRFLLAHSPTATQSNHDKSTSSEKSSLS